MISNATGTEKYAFTGQYSEADIGLYYFGARWYDASLGRFISEDPLKGSMTSSQSQNPYVYCMNNPLRFIDPSGMMGDIPDWSLPDDYFDDYVDTAGSVVNNMTNTVTDIVTGAINGTGTGSNNWTDNIPTPGASSSSAYYLGAGDDVNTDDYSWDSPDFYVIGWEVTAVVSPVELGGGVKMGTMYQIYTEGFKVHIDKYTYMGPIGGVPEATFQPFYGSGKGDKNLEGPSNVVYGSVNPVGLFSGAVDYTWNENTRIITGGPSFGPSPSPVTVGGGRIFTSRAPSINWQCDTNTLPQVFM